MAAQATIPMTGKVVLVTGGYTALGRALAGGFARAGADLGLIARTQNKLEEAAKDMRALGVKALPLVADITDEAQVVSAFARARRELGRIDVLVNNTGLPGVIMPVEQMDLTEWNTIIGTNLTGAMLCCREAVRHMGAQGGGAIINIGSSAGKRGVPFSSAYSASKFGLIGLTQALAQEVGKKGIRVNCIALGSPEGPRTDWQLERKSKAGGFPVAEERARRMGGTALGRFVSQDEFASLALFLASDLSSGMTGQAINLTAGGLFH